MCINCGNVQHFRLIKPGFLGGSQSVVPSGHLVTASSLTILACTDDSLEDVIHEVKYLNRSWLVLICAEIFA